MTRFDWQTEEENWPEVEFSEQKRRPSPKRHRGRLALISLLLVGVLVLAYQVVDRQVADREEAVTADVLSSHFLISQAAAETDLPLFASFLSGRDDRWTQTQSELVSQKLFGDLSTLGLQGPAGDGQVVDVTLSPDFTAAEVVISRTYQTDLGTASPEMVELRQTAVYRRGADRWLFAPPDEEFWGRRIIGIGRHLVVNYPQRDRETAGLLLAYIDAKLQTLCDSLSDRRCSDSRPLVWLTLSTDPSTFIHMADEGTRPYDGASMSLPAPSLVGIPMSEAGQQAFARGYAVLVLRSVLARLLDWSCCDHGLIVRAMLDYELNRLGVQGWPMSPADYAALLDDWRPLFSESGAWNEPVFNPAGSRNWQRAYAMVAFLASLSMRLPLVEMAQSLSRASYQDWLQQVIPPVWARAAVEEEWRRFVEQRSSMGLTG